jgi:hypothetical protein
MINRVGVSLRDMKQKSDALLPTNIDSNLLKFTKIPLYLESQHYPAKAIGNNSSFHDHLKRIQDLEDEEKKETLLQAIKEHNIHIVGIDLSISELRALRAIQRLLSLTDYQGNLSEESKMFDGNNVFNFFGYITPLKMRVADYLVAYGVNKNISKTGKARFNSHERQEALKAVSILSSRMFYFYFSKKRWVKSPLDIHIRKEKLEVTQAVSPLFKCYYPLTHESDLGNEPNNSFATGASKGSRTYAIVIEPTPIMVLGIKTYFMFIPPYEKDIRQASNGKRIPKEVYTFVGYLIYQAEIRRGKNYGDWSTIAVESTTLIYKLRLDHYFSKKLRNPQKAYDIIACCLEYACRAEYIDSYILEEKQELEKVYIFNLNAEKFYHEGVATQPSTPL